LTLRQLFQNLIRKKIMRIDDDQIFTKIDVHEKFTHIIEPRGQEVYRRGEDILRQGKGTIESS
jgi:hypothetical protein